jgi:predicted DNA-binding protein
MIKKATKPRITRDALMAIRTTAELKERIERLAEADNRPLSNYLENVLRAHADAAEADEIVPRSQSGGTRESTKSRK